MKFGQFDIDTCSFFSYANFPSCPNNDFHRTFAFYPGYSLGSCIVFSCHNVFALFSWRQFLSLSLSFMTLIFFKSTGHLFYRMFFNFEWSGFFFLMIRFRLCIFGRNISWVSLCISHASCKEAYNVSFCHYWDS